MSQKEMTRNFIAQKIIGKIVKEFSRVKKNFQSIKLKIVLFR